MPYLTPKFTAITKRVILRQWLGFFLLIFGVCIGFNWLSTSSAKGPIISDPITMRFNSALGFALLGLMFMLYRVPAEFWRRALMQILAAGLTAGAAGIVAEHCFHLDLGIDWDNLHRTLISSEHPGLISLPTSVSFFMAGIAMMLLNYATSMITIRLIKCLALFIFSLGIVCAIGDQLGLDFFYYFQVNHRMAPASALCFMATGLGIWLMSRECTTHSIHANNSPDERNIIQTAALTMVMLALASGFCGFVMLKQIADDTLSSKLQIEARAGADHFTDSLGQRLQLAATMAAMPEFSVELTKLAANPNDDAVKRHLVEMAGSYASAGFDSITFYDAQNQLLAHFGAVEPDGLFSLPVNDDRVSSLLEWDNRFVLRTEKVIGDNIHPLGKIVTLMRLDQLTEAFHALQYASATADAGLCGNVNGMMTCFPNRSNKKPISVPMYKDGKPTFPMVYALNGKAVTMQAISTQGIPILASVEPIGSTGLGIGIRIETAELYRTVRRQMEILVAAIFVLIVAGMLIIYRRVRPLARRLVISERASRDANLQLTKDADRLHQVIATQDFIASASFNLEQVMQKSVDQLQQLTSATGTVIELIEGDELVYRATSGGLEPYKGIRIKLADSLSGLCAATKDIINCPDAVSDPRVNHAMVVELKIGSMMVAPLMHDGVVLGILKIASGFENAFGNSERDTLKLLSGLIGSAIGKQIDYDIKQELLAERTHMAQHDGLTGLPNRALFHDRLTGAILRAGRSEKAMALMFIDLDGFKQVNDTHGHKAGDEVLKEFVKRAGEIIRKTDVIARLAGDEFVIILENLSDPVPNVTVLANKILKATEVPFLLNGQFAQLSASIGIAINSSDAIKIDELIHLADEEMYKAKKGGKNRFSLKAEFKPSPSEPYPA